MIEGTQHDVETLLPLAGAHPPRHGRGKWLCPDCHRPTLSVNLGKQVFNCHYAGCQFHGGIGALRKRLGIRRDWLPESEYRRLRLEHQRARDAAQRLYLAVESRRKDLLDLLRGLSQLEMACHKTGATHVAWRGLEITYTDRPKVLAELVILENAMAADLVRFLLAGKEVRSATIGRVLSRGGFYPRAGEYVEVQP